MALDTQPRLTHPDDFYEALIDMHRDLDDAQSQAANAQLILLLANQIGDPEAFAGRFGMVISLAAAEIGAWVVPLAGLALIAPRIGIGGRFVPFAVAYNWAMAIAAWISLPAALLTLFLPFTDQMVVLVALVLFLLSEVLIWRLTNASIGRGAAIATAVFTGMLIGSQAVSFGLQVLLGISMPDMP